MNLETTMGPLKMVLQVCGLSARQRVALDDVEKRAITTATSIPTFCPFSFNSAFQSTDRIATPSFR
jgi:hypothetical protein